MRITKADLLWRWRWSSLLAMGVFAILAFGDVKLRAISGLGTADLQGFWTAGQYRITHVAWRTPPETMRAGFNLGLDYLFMPLYAASFFYSAVIAREVVLSPGLRRLLAMAAMVPVVGAPLDALENALELYLVLIHADDRLAGIAYGISAAKMAAFAVGLALFAGAVFAQVLERKRKALKSGT